MSDGHDPDCQYAEQGVPREEQVLRYVYFDDYLGKQPVAECPDCQTALPA